jgi:hypothetical protein
MDINIIDNNNNHINFPLKVSSDLITPSPINLADNSDKDLEVFTSGLGNWNGDKISSAKRNLLAAFTESVDAGAVSNKITKKGIEFDDAGSVSNKATNQFAEFDDAGLVPPNDVAMHSKG